MKGLISGCGRSGTGYLAEVLNAAGEGCGHEIAFNVYGPHPSRHQYESSWYAAPFLDQLPTGTPVIHLVRDPYKVIRSFHRIGLLSDQPFRHVTYGRSGFHPKAWMLHHRKIRARWRFVIQHRRYLRDHLEIWDEADEVKRLSIYWLRWNAMIEAETASLKLPYLRVRLEDIDRRLDEIASFLGTMIKLEPRAPANAKAGYKPRPMPIISLPDAVSMMAERYGYG